MNILNGFHCPNIITAKAKKPKPATPTVEFQYEEVGIIYAKAPNPPKAPEIKTPTYL